MCTNFKITGNSINHRIISCFFVAGFFLLLSPSSANAQVLDTISPPDTVIHHHSVRKAVLYSLICPGLGQVYNTKYWKIPFIYGAGGTFLYYVGFNQMKYKKFKDAIFAEQITKRNVVIDGYSFRYESLGLGRDYYRRYRDLSIAGLAGIYLLNVIDAMVDATFFYYDISDDLTMKVEPAVIENIDIIGTTASLGFRINIGF